MVPVGHMESYMHGNDGSQKSVIPNWYKFPKLPGVVRSPVEKPFVPNSSHCLAQYALGRSKVNYR
jgi:hypothetical protein